MGMLHQQFERLAVASCKAARETFGDNLVALAVFGSVGRGTPRFDSDLDLLGVLETAPRQRRDRWLLAEGMGEHLRPLQVELAGQGVNAELSLVLKSRAELVAGFPLLLDMVDDGVILTDPYGVLAARLALLRQRLTAAGARRIWVGNAWHWDLGSGAFEI